MQFQKTVYQPYGLIFVFNDPERYRRAYIKCEDFMYMGSVDNGEPQKNIHLYKHINTRKYINISDGGLLYTYGQNEYSPLINFSYEEKINTILEL